MVKGRYRRTLRVGQRVSGRLAQVRLGPRRAVGDGAGFEVNDSVARFRLLDRFHGSDRGLPKGGTSLSVGMVRGNSRGGRRLLVAAPGRWLRRWDGLHLRGGRPRKRRIRLVTRFARRCRGCAGSGSVSHRRSEQRAESGRAADRSARSGSSRTLLRSPEPGNDAVLHGPPECLERPGTAVDLDVHLHAALGRIGHRPLRRGRDRCRVEAAQVTVAERRVVLRPRQRLRAPPGELDDSTVGPVARLERGGLDPLRRRRLGLACGRGHWTRLDVVGAGVLFRVSAALPTLARIAPAQIFTTLWRDAPVTQIIPSEAMSTPSGVRRGPRLSWANMLIAPSISKTTIR